MPKIRQNPLTDEWSVVAPERAKRPEEYALRPFSSQMTHLENCPLCVGGEAWQERLAKITSQSFFVIPNKYPAFLEEPKMEVSESGLFNEIGSFGEHQIIVANDPADTLNLISSTKLLDLLSVLRDRVIAYQDEQSIISVLPFYNHGQESGASIAHPHAQFIASLLTPPLLQREITTSSHYFERHHRCLVCDLNHYQLKNHRRLVVENDQAAAFTSFAPRFPFEIIIIPRHHQAAFSLVDSNDLSGFAWVVHQVLQRFNNKLNNPSLNWYIHTTLPKQTDLKETFHWHLEITPRLGLWGGYEIGGGATIETADPETAARFLA